MHACSSRRVSDVDVEPTRSTGPTMPTRAAGDRRAGVRRHGRPDRRGALDGAFMSAFVRARKPRSLPEDDVPALAWRERHAPESAQLHDRARDGRQHIPDVELHDLVAAVRPGVGHDAADGGRLSRPDGRRLDAQIRVLERRVAESVAEGEQRHAGQIDVVVASARRLVVVVERQLAFRHRKRQRQASGGIRASEDRVRHGVTAGLTRIPRVDDGGDAFQPWHGDGAAANEDDDRRLARRRDGLDQFGLAAGQPELRPVAKLALLHAADNHHGIAGGCGCDRLTDLPPPRLGDTGIPDELQPGVARRLEILQPDAMDRSRRQRHRRHADAVRPLLPVIDDEFVIEIEPVAVVALDADPRHAVRRHRDRAGPAGGVPIERDAAAGRVQRPAEVDARVRAREPRRPVEPRIVEVLAGQAARRPVRRSRRQLFRWNDDGVADETAGTGSEAHGDAGAGRPPDAVQDRDRVIARSAVAAQARLFGIHADDRDRPRRAGKRQHGRFVLQQHQRGLCRLTRQGAVAAVAETGRRLARIDVRLLEQTQFELHAQHARHRVIDCLHGNQAALERVQVRPLLSVGRLEHDVEAGRERALGGRRRTGLCHVQHRRAAGAGRVRNHESAKSPVAFQHVGQKPAVLMRGQAVHRVVGGHHRPRAGLERGLERREVPLGQHARVVMHRIAVAAAFPDIRHKVLRRRHHAEPFERFDVGLRHD
jgi:hypothetical protein